MSPESPESPGGSMSEGVLPPERVRFADEEKTVLAIDWRDGHASAYPLDYLRGWCPCAVCQGHGPGTSFSTGGATSLAGLRHVGSYALGLSWQGGHDSGIYTWARLRELCPCEACGGPVDGTPEVVAERARAARP